jgi:sec-independent protein translocase protein TatA
MLQSPIDIALVAGVFLLIFGPKKLPELGKAIGLGIGNFKRGLLDAQDEIKTAIKEEPPAVKAAPTPVAVGTEKITETSPATPSFKEEEITPPKW